MKLGEALTTRADTQKRAHEMLSRIEAVARIEEGDTPLEDPSELLAETDMLFGVLQSLIARINRTNLATILPSGGSVTDALAERDVLKLRIAALQKAITAASGGGDRWRYRGAEAPKEVPTLDVKQIRASLDKLSQRFREVDTAIQAANWTTDLLD